MGDEDLKGRLERLGDRGTPRGAGAVFAAAREQAGRGTAGVARVVAGGRGMAAAAVAASVLVVAATVAAAVHDGGTDTTTAGAPLTSLPGRLDAPESAPGTTGAPAASSTTSPPAPGAKLSPALVAARLRPVPSCDALVRSARAKAMEVVGPYGLPGLGGSMGGRRAAQPGAPMASTTEDRAAAPPPAFSGTNVQEAGVDEPDLVKTDGRRVLALANGRLWYATMEGGVTRVRSSLEVAGADQGHLLLAGDRALVVATNYGGAPAAEADRAAASPLPGTGAVSTAITVVDVAGPAMRVVTTVEAEGAYLDGRLLDGVARLVVRSEPQGLRWRYPQDGSDQAMEQAKRENREVVAASTTANWVPDLRVTDGAGRTRAERPLVACDAAYAPQQFSGFGTLTVLTLDPARPEAAKPVSVQAGGDLVYASPRSIYVATTAWKRVEGGTVTPAPQTLVHRFDITDRTQARYLVSGTVRGYPLNQFSFSEHEGHLRVATTDMAGVEPATESFVSVLRDDGRALVQVGQVGGLGKGERVYAVRFLGERGYVVTFRQTDPLYVVDLSAPTRPRVNGELKILGYSAYLHPIGDDLLLGVGQDATEEGRRLGSQVSVFDVRDPSRPARLHQKGFGSGSSQVEYDHHAFLWWPAAGLAMLPLHEYDPGTGRPAFLGVVGLTAGRGGLTEAGRVQHPGENGSRPAIERSLVIGDALLTVSRGGILTSSLAGLGERGWAAFG